LLFDNGTTNNKTNNREGVSNETIHESNYGWRCCGDDHRCLRRYDG
jgi:hypothetical protein